GIDSAMALLFHKAGQRLPKDEPGVVPDFVTPEGIVVNVSTTALETHGVLPIVSEPPMTAESIITQAIQDGRAAHDPLLADPAAEARLTAQEVQAWMDGLPVKDTPTTGPRDLYEIAQTGPKNFHVGVGDDAIWVDGVRPPDASLLEAKYIDNPARSPYIDGSNCADFVRQNARDQVDREFRRYAVALQDPQNPVNTLEVIV